MTLTIGIDDAGRGPIIGPMILAGVLVDQNAKTILQKHPIDDSKIIAHPKRIQLANLIKQTVPHHIVQANPKTIDEALNTPGNNLNRLEALKMAEIINELNDKKTKTKVIVDCPSINTESWQVILEEYIDHKENLEISCEHKADANHLEPAAASILAKVTREEEMDKIKQAHPDIGSGYPSDPNTKAFLAKTDKAIAEEGIIRTSWQTWKKLHPEKDQSTLGSF